MLQREMRALARLLCDVAHVSPLQLKRLAQDGVERLVRALRRGVGPDRKARDVQQPQLRVLCSAELGERAGWDEQGSRLRASQSAALSRSSLYSIISAIFCSTDVGSCGASQRLSAWAEEQR